MEILGNRPDNDPFSDPRVVACAARWAWKLRRGGITDFDADDLRNEACRLAHPHLGSDEIEDPVAYLCRVVMNAARMRMRHGAEISIDPTDSPLAGLAADDPSYAEREAEMHLVEILHYMERNRAEIWERGLAAFGATERADSLWSVSIKAIEHLILQDANWGVDETLKGSMQADPWWRANGVPGESIKTIMERRRKRQARDIHWVSYVVLFVALRWANAENPRVCRKLAARHLAHLAITLNECRGASARAALERHIAVVKKAAGLDE